MARAKEFTMQLSGALLGLGLLLAILSYTWKFAGEPGWLDFYGGTLEAIPGATADGYNLWIIIISTLLVVFAGFYFGEQIVLRRRFERLISTPKKSEFASNRKDLDQLVGRLPASYKDRVREKEASFRSLR